MGKRILEGLGENPEQIHKFIEKSNPTSEFDDISLDQFQVISEWYYFAILSLAETEDFKPDAKWISKRLQYFNDSGQFGHREIIKT